MRIAVASDDGTSISAHFGRSAGFAIFDCENGEITKGGFRPNTFGHHAAGECNHEQEAGQHSHAGFLSALHDCQVIICRGMGRRAVADMQANGINIAITAETIEAETAARLYAQNRLNSSDQSDCCSH